MSYTWQVLRVNLGTGSVAKEPLNKDWAEKYFGGRGLGAKYLYEEIEGGTDPLSPANKLMLVTGPFTGTMVPCSGKLAIVTKSPATGLILDCSIGGSFAAYLKFAGYDMLIVEGQAEKPVYLAIDDDKVEIRDAGHLWGKGIFDTESWLRAEHKPEAGVLSIGPAGENLVAFACIGSEFYRQAGRGGVGSVMGSKRLKAIVCSGSKDVTVPDMPRLLEMTGKVVKDDVLTEDNLWAHSEGTPMIVDMSNSSGILPTRNFQDGVFEGAARINSNRIQELRPQKKSCISCALGCGNYVTLGDGRVEGPEYETLALAGANCGIDDLGAIVKLNSECDDLGMDTISVGNVIGFAMEMTEKGLKDFGVRFGDVGTYLKIPRLIAYREGIGKDLSLGTKALARMYGGAEFAVQVKGLELPGYDPRGSWSMGLAYATASRGGCHMSAWAVANEAFGDLDPFTIEGKAQYVAEAQDMNAIKFSLILCDFWAASMDTMSELLSCVLGREVSSAELNKAGERIWTLLRLFNVREGSKGAEDSLPGRFFNEALRSGNPAGKSLPREQFEAMLREYYKLRGWDDDGVPTKQKVAELEI